MSLVESAVKSLRSLANERRDRYVKAVAVVNFAVVFISTSSMFFHFKTTAEFGSS